MSQTRISVMRAYATVMAAFLLASNGLVREADAKSTKTLNFPVALVHFEQNASDGDVEVVFEAKGQADGLANLKVVSPDGRTVVEFTAPDSSTLGMRQFRIESPEPKDAKALKAAYPEGVYKFTGRSLSGATLVGESILSHRLPAPVKFRKPAPNAKNVPIRNINISWSAVTGVAFYILEIEQEELKTKIEATLPGSSTSFAVPNGFLMPDKEYHLGIGTVSAEGNVSVVETSFSTKK